MATIRVQQVRPGIYDVEVDDGDSSTRHEVSATDDDIRRLGAGALGEAVVEESFRFLLERENKESILPSFHILLIARYFPEYLEEFPARMQGRRGS